jgi:hypothetical protein
MSKIVDAINYQLIGESESYRSLGLEFTDVSTEISDDHDICVKKFSVGVSLRQTAHISFHSLEYSVGDLIIDETINEIKAAMIEEIFGEFRPDMWKIRTALWEQDLAKARQSLIDLEHKMFDI